MCLRLYMSVHTAKPEMLTSLLCALTCVQVINVTPRYAKLHDTNGAVFGWENMELISGVISNQQIQQCAVSMQLSALRTC